MRDSISLISYAGGLGQYISAKIHSMCAPQPKIAKNSLKPIFLGFKVIDVGTPEKKLVSSVCYDTQQVCLSATILPLD